jgi:hypothetical protein
LRAGVEGPLSWNAATQNFQFHLRRRTHRQAVTAVTTATKLSLGLKQRGVQGDCAGTLDPPRANCRSLDYARDDKSIRFGGNRQLVIDTLPCHRSGTEAEGSAAYRLVIPTRAEGSAVPAESQQRFGRILSGRALPIGNELISDRALVSNHGVKRQLAKMNIHFGRHLGFDSHQPGQPILYIQM